MKRSTDRILTTHVGSLIRPPELQEFYRAKQTGQPYDQGAYERTLQGHRGADRQAAGRLRHRRRSATASTARRSPGRNTCWSGWAASSAGRSRRRATRWRAAPTAAASPSSTPSSMPTSCGATTMDSVVVGPITYTGQALLQKDIDNFKAALADVKVTEAFLPVAAPASVIPDRKNEFYKNDDDVLAAIGDAMRDRIQADHRQRLAGAARRRAHRRHLRPHGAARAPCRTICKWVARHVEILNARSRGCRAKRSAITSAGAAGRGRTPPTFRSRASSS